MVKAEGLFKFFEEKFGEKLLGVHNNIALVKNTEDVKLRGDRLFFRLGEKGLEYLGGKLNSISQVLANGTKNKVKMISRPTAEKISVDFSKNNIYQNTTLIRRYNANGELIQKPTKGVHKWVVKDIADPYSQYHQYLNKPNSLWH